MQTPIFNTYSIYKEQTGSNKTDENSYAWQVT